MFLRDYGPFYVWWPIGMFCEGFSSQAVTPLGGQTWGDTKIRTQLVFINDLWGEREQELFPELTKRLPLTDSGQNK